MSISRKLQARANRNGNTSGMRLGMFELTRRGRRNLSRPDALPPENVEPETISDTIERLCGDGNYEEALKVLEAWRQDDPENLDIILNIISIRGRSGIYDQELIDTLSGVIEIAFSQQSESELNPIFVTNFARKKNIYLFDLLVQRATTLQGLGLEPEFAARDLRMATELDPERMDRLRAAIDPWQELEICFAQLEIDGAISITEENVSYLERAIEILRNALAYRNELKMQQLLIGMLHKLAAYYKSTGNIDGAVENLLIILEYDAANLNIIIELDEVTRNAPELLTGRQIAIQDLYLNAMSSSMFARVSMLAGLLDVSEDTFREIMNFFEGKPSSERIFEKIGELSALLQSLADEERWLDSIDIYKQIMLYHPTFALDLYNSGVVLSASLDELRRQYENDGSLWQIAFALATKSEEAEDPESANLYYESIVETLKLLEDTNTNGSSFSMI